MDFPQNMSMEEAFALAEAEAKLNQALSESKDRFENAVLPNRLNEDWRFGRPHKYATALAELLQSGIPSQGEAMVEHAGEAAVAVTTEDDDLRQTEMLMPTIGSDALLGMHLERFGSGYALYIEEDTKEPIRIEYTTTGFYTPSTFIMVAPGVRAEVVEIHHGIGEAASMFATRNIQVAEGAKLKLLHHSSNMERYMCITNIQNMGGQVVQLTRHDTHDWAREETVAEIYTPGSDTQLYSSNLPRNGVLDLHTKQIHHAGGATSNLLYKNVVYEGGTAIFAGNIFVAPGAHNTDAYQSNRNLLLSEKATVHSLPGLEILADKVRCSHGSASSGVDEQQLFYLLSRGIPREEAIDLLAYGFERDVIEKYERA
ncbi:MAG: SufD family Fe-S cluster assembly protein [Akkermansia sp.]|nr:SufD family Fe-S cluster assembly protein [Akkermansia sp.]